MEAKINVSLKEGKFELEGSEEFVNKQIENFKDLLMDTLESTGKRTPINHKSETNNQQDSSSKNGLSNSDLSIGQHPFVYVEDGEEIELICDIPGSSDSKQTLNAAILYAYGRYLQGEKEANVESVRAICKNHGCYQKKNFSAYVNNGHPTYFLDKGSGKTRTIKLNRPGIKEAKELIKQITENEKE